MRSRGTVVDHGVGLTIGLDLGPNKGDGLSTLDCAWIKALEVEWELDVNWSLSRARDEPHWAATAAKELIRCSGLSRELARRTQSSTQPVGGK